MRGIASPICRTEAFPQPYRYGPLPVWTRRVSVLRLSAAARGGEAAADALPEAGQSRQPLDAGALVRGRLSHGPAGFSRKVPCQRSKPANTTAAALPGRRL